MYKKLVAQIIGLLLLACPLCALEVDLRLTKDYKNYYQDCSLDYRNFRNNLLIETYMQSLRSSISILSLDAREIQLLKNTRGLSVHLFSILQSEPFLLAMKDCHKSESSHNLLVAELLGVESMGKLVGISIGTVGGTYAGKVLKLTYAALYVYSPLLAKLSAGSLSLGSAFMSLKKNQENQKTVASSENDSVLAEIEWRRKFVEQGNSQLKTIRKMLLQADLDEDERKRLEVQARSWEKTLSIANPNATVERPWVFY